MIKKDFKSLTLYREVYIFVNEKANIYHDLKKIKISDEIKNTQHSVICPFCVNGFKKEVKYYFLENKNILDYLKE